MQEVSSNVIKVDRFIIDDEGIKEHIKKSTELYKELGFKDVEFVGIHFLFVVKDGNGNEYLAKSKIERTDFDENEFEG